MPLLVSAKFKRSAIRESVADEIRERLLGGGYMRGETISEITIAGEFHISRGPVREALLTLQNEGLLTHTPNRGFSILDFSVADVELIDKVRLALEPLALSAAKAHVTAHNISMLTALKDQLVQAVAGDRKSQCVAAEVQFHSLVWELSGNPWLVTGLRRVVIPAFTYGAAFRLARPDFTPQRMNVLHQVYIDYLEGSEDLSAEDCVRTHLGVPVKHL